MIEKLLQKSLIQIYTGFNIIDWTVNDSNVVENIIFESDLERKEFPCSLFVCFDRKIVLRKTILGMVTFKNNKNN